MTPAFRADPRGSCNAFRRAIPATGAKSHRSATPGLSERLLDTAALLRIVAHPAQCDEAFGDDPAVLIQLLHEAARRLRDNARRAPAGRGAIPGMVAGALADLCAPAHWPGRLPAFRDGCAQAAEWLEAAAAQGAEEAPAGRRAAA